MNTLTPIELLVSASLVFQLGTIAFTVYLLKVSKLSKGQRQPWIWFLVSLLVTAFRRLMAVCRYFMSFGSIELEYVVTILISVCWIMGVYSFLKDRNDTK